jgi:hypothetical protein
MTYKFINLNREEPEGLYIPQRVEKWYSRSERSWVVQVLDKHGNQVGDATYVHSREEANDEVEYQKKVNNLK